MRLLKLFVVVGVLAALVVPAGAINFKHAYTGPVTMKLVNWDMGTIYQPGTPGTTTDGIAAVNALTQNPFPGTAYDAISGAIFTGAAGQEREDGWGIYKITDIRNSLDSTDILWDMSFGQANGIELYGIFYGLIDNAVRNSSDNVGQVLIQATNMTFAMWENSFGSFAAAGGEVQGSAGRLAIDSYNGITNAGGTNILEGVSVMGDLAQLNGATGPQGFQSVFVPILNLTSGEGTFFSRIALTDTTLRDYNQFNTNGFVAGADGIPVDFTLNGTTFANTGPNAVGDWSVLSEDPLRGAVIPEPVSMASLFLGVVGIGGYLRRRSRVA